MRCNKKWLLILAFSLMVCGCSSETGNVSTETAEEYSAEKPEMKEGRGENRDGQNRDGENRGGQNGGGRNGGSMVENDAEVQSVLDANADKFVQMTYEDPENNITLEYSLFIPEDMEENEEYPLIMFIPDSTGSGKSAEEIVSQYYGATVWVTEEEQEKHKSFVLVPAFSETVVDDNWNVSDQVETAYHLIMDLIENYSINTDKIYTTGQSMGCMTSLYLNSKYPELFAASLFVSGQWDISVLDNLKDQKFFYITAAGDEKASGGQEEVMEMLDAAGVDYSYDTWDAQASAEEQNEKVAKLLSENCSANMIRFEEGTVLTDEQAMEHMASFNYAYKLEAVRDWLFEQ